MSDLNVYADWQEYGGTAIKFTTYDTNRTPKRISVAVEIDKVIAYGEQLRMEEDREFWTVNGFIPHGKGRRAIHIEVPRALMIEMAEALAGYTDQRDARHRWWHTQNIAAPRPCSSCTETVEANKKAINGKRLAFFKTWARRLGASVEEIESLTTAYDKLPTFRDPRI